MSELLAKIGYENNNVNIWKEIRRSNSDWEY